MKENQRRTFIKQTMKQTFLVALGLSSAGKIAEAFGGANNPGFNTHSGFGFDQQPLPYTYDALEDVIDAKTMEIHYTKHAAAYAKNAKEAAIAEQFDIRRPIEEMLSEISKYSMKLRNNAGGHYNHELFWQCMRPKSNNNQPKGQLLDDINYTFGGFDTFKTQFSDAAKSRFGSGWAWLYKTADGALKIGSTANQDNPLMNLSGSEVRGVPILGLDIWEHAYYLKYQNRRADYIQNWWSLVNWDYVQKRYEQI